MKILQVIDTLHIGGAEKVFINQCNILYAKGIDVSCLFLLQKGVLHHLINQNISCIELKRKNKWSLMTMYKCAAMLKEYHIIHCHSKHVYRYIALVNLLFFLRKKIILQDHSGIFAVEPKVPLFFNSILKPSYYIAVSSKLLSWAQNAMKLPNNRSFLLQNCIVKSNVKVSFPTAELLLISNIKENKNQLFAVKLAQKLKKSLVVVGKNQDNKYYHSLINAIQEAPCSISIEQNTTDAQSIIHNFQIGLHTSYYETGPLVLLEYLSNYKPFLAYDTGEVAQILKPYFPDYFIDNFDEQQWIDRLNYLSNQPVDITKIDAVFEKYFSEEQYFCKLKTIYLCVLKD